MDAPLVRDLGLRPLPDVWAEMQAFTAQRTADTRDEIWFVEHPPVYTLGMRADRSHLLAPGDIPVVQIDRGGQVTYHGPGQLVVYVLLNLRGGPGRRASSYRRSRTPSSIPLPVTASRPKPGAMHPACTWPVRSWRPWGFG